MGCSVSHYLGLFVFVLTAYFSDFVEYFVAKDLSQFKVLPEADIPYSCYVGVAGMPGETASYSWQVMMYSAGQCFDTDHHAGVFEGEEGQWACGVPRLLL